MEANAPERIETLIRDWLLGRVAQVTRTPLNRIEVDQPVTAYGMDSLAAATLAGELEEWLGCPVHNGVFFGTDTISGVSRALGAREDVRAALEARVSGEPVQVEIAPATEYHGGENFDLADIIRMSGRLPFAARVESSARFLRDVTSGGLYRREVASSTDREVVVVDPATRTPARMLMFGSNSYLGLAGHPKVAARVRAALDTDGVGLGGAPLLSGYTRLHRELEERLAALKGTEAAMLYSTGYSANVGSIQGCCNDGSFVICDEYSHASFRDGLKLTRVPYAVFRHNDVDHLRELLRRHCAPGVDVFVGVEGLYSMDGDVAPLDRIVETCEEFGAVLMVDDAHATGVLGSTGSGSAERFGVKGRVPVLVGTLSKAVAGLGGFVCGSRDLIDFLRYLSRSYMFSTSMPPTLVAQALGALEVMEQEPERLLKLRDNIRLAHEGFARVGITVHGDPESPILAVRAPVGMDIHRAAALLHAMGVFVNVVEFPAVPLDQQRFRISIMSSHTTEDIARLVSSFAEMWEQTGFQTKAQGEKPRLKVAG